VNGHPAPSQEGVRTSNHGLKLGSKRCVGRTETDRKITGEPWLSTVGQRNMTKETTLRSGGRSLSTKDLTELTLLEISGKRVSQDLTRSRDILVAIRKLLFWSSDVPNF
jgi:hypothetical protein